MVRYPHRITPRKGVFLHALGKCVLSICSTYHATPWGHTAEQDRAYVLRKFLIDLRNFFFFKNTGNFFRRLWVLEWAKYLTTREQMKKGWG